MVTEEERKKALADARAVAMAKLQGMRLDMSENEQALFLAIEQELGLTREECIKRLQLHKKQEFDRIVDEEYKRNISTIDRKEKWTRKWMSESFKALEEVMVPVSVGSEQKILGWDFRFRDEKTGAKSPTIRELFQYLCGELPNPLVLRDRGKFVQEAATRYDRKVFEHMFDRKEVDGDRWKDEGTRYYSVKFMLRRLAVQPKT